MWGWIIGAGAALVAAIAYRQHRAQAGHYRPLSQRQPQRRSRDAKPPLGTEALDLSGVNSVLRRNESLERGQTNWTHKGFGPLLASATTDVAPLADDETYAARYHAAFHKDQPKDQRDERCRNTNQRPDQQE